MGCRTKVVRSCKAGRFKVTLLELTMTNMEPDEWLRDFKPEPTNVRLRVAIQYSRKIDGKWVNETIYCTTDDFRNLQNAIDEFTEVERDDKSPQPNDEVADDE
jgi:hypothetical protein